MAGNIIIGRLVGVSTSTFFGDTGRTKCPVLQLEVPVPGTVEKDAKVLSTVPAEGNVREPEASKEEVVKTTIEIPVTDEVARCFARAFQREVRLTLFDADPSEPVKTKMT